MKRPGDPTPAPPGGRAAARQRMYEEQRSAEPAKKQAAGPAKRKKAKTKKRWRAMRSKPDLARNRRGATQRRKTRRPGGKVLQRLFTYLGQRDPAFNNDVVATVAVPKAVRPSYALTKQALQMKPVTAASAKRTRRRPPAAVVRCVNRKGGEEDFARAETE